MEGEVIAARTMNSLYIWLDIAYLMILLGVLLWTKRRQAVIAGLIGGALYFAVDTVCSICFWEHGKWLEQIRFGFCYGFPSVTDLQISYGYGCGWTAMDIP